MAIISNINDKLTVSDQGQVSFNRVDDSQITGYSFPTTDGSANQILKTNGLGILTFVTDDPGGNVTGSGTLNKVARWTATGDDLGDGPITFSSAGAAADSTFGGNITTAVDGRISIGTWDNSAFTSGNAYGFYVESATPILILDESSETYTGYVGLSGGIMYVGGIITSLIMQTGSAGATALTIDSDQAATFAGTVTTTDVYGTNSLRVAALGGILYLDSSSGTSTIMRTNGTTTALTLNSSQNATFAGNVTLNQYLEISSTTAQYAYMNFGGDSTGYGWQLGKAPATGGVVDDQGFYLYNLNTGYQGVNLAVLKSGNVGIGTTTPGALLQVGNGTAPSSTDQQGAHVYGYDGALSLYTTRQGESPFNAALYLYNNPAAGTGTGTGILFRAKTGGGGGSEFTQGRIQGAVYTSWTTNTDATRTSKMVFRTTDSAVTSDKVTILGNGNVGIGLTAPVAKLHVENKSATSPFAINAQMLIGYNGGSQNFFDADLQYFRNAAFQNILQLSGDGIVGTPNNTQRLRITTDYTQIGPVPVRYPYYRTDSFKSDGSGYFYAFGHENNNGNQSISMMFNDGASGNKYTRIINNLQLSSFASNEVNGQYPTFTTNVVLKNSGTSYFKGGDVAIGATSAGARLDVVMPNSGGVDRQDILRLLQSGQNTLSCYMYGGATDLVQLHVSGTEQNLSLTVGGVATATTSKGIHIRHLTGYVGIDDISPSYQLDVAGDIRATGDVIAYSDVRVKENIKTIDNSLEKVSKLRGVEFNKIGDNIKSIGVIAQEVEKVIPEVVREDDKGMKSVAYGNITGILIEAIKELKAEIEELKSNKCNCNK